MPELKAYSADRIFTGENWLSGQAVVKDNGIIVDIVSLASLSKEIAVENFPGCFLAPAFIDLQIYGAYGKLLAVYPEADSLYKLNEYCNSGGAAFCMPTVATNTYDVFYQCIDAVKDYWGKDGKGVLGLHIEGPWINPVKRGAHIESLIHSPSVRQVEELLNYGKGVIKIITLAPEVCSKEVTDLILSHDIIISAGHSNATYNEAITGFSHGISAVTHLYNAMSPLQHRQPGLVGATMDHNSVRASIIPDGHHVDYAAIRIAKAVMKERLFVITDAVTETDKGYYPHELAGDKYESLGILSGSALTMDKAVSNLVIHAGISLDEALRMCSLYPAKLIGRDHELGRISKGYRAAIVVMNERMETQGLPGF
ncbi:MAG: N-acetylglucosamine-6-phosphate deacetylase [Chitinophagaceae bacterium]|nr:N-acetylglucosamine-6-phosphate deacetylase [Chitinophagaceae bacterium]